MGVRERFGAARGFLASRPLAVVTAAGGAVLLADAIRRLLAGTLTFSGLLTYTWDGVVLGLAIGLAGIGLSMTYSILRFANFSHGDYVTAGAFAGWSISFLVAGLDTGDIGYLLLVGVGDGPSSRVLGITVLSTPAVVLVGLIVAALATVALALVLDRIVYRPMRDHGAIALLIASIGVALALRYVIVFVFEASRRGLTATTQKVVLGAVDGRVVLASSEGAVTTAIETGLPSAGGVYAVLPVVDVGGYSAVLLNVTSHEIALVVAAALLMVGVHLLLQRTTLGKAMRATADNRSLARVTGIPTERVIRATWIVGGGLAGAAGYLIALETGTIVFTLGWGLLLLIFAAVILGGIGSIYGAIAGGLLVGVASRISLVWVPSGFATAAAFALMILVLLVRPSVLFGGVTTA